MTSFVPGNNALMLNISTQAGLVQQYRLSEGTTLIVGQGRSCGLRLEGGSVSQMHCVLRLSKGTLTAQDWCSASGTFVDGARVNDETEVAFGVAIRVGDYEIMAGLSEEAPASVEPCGKESDDAEIELPIGETAEAEEDDEPPEPELPDDALAESDELETEAIAAARESSAVKPWQAAESLEPQAADPPRRSRTAISWDEETNALLQEEIELLQSELAERDARIQELTAVVETATDPVPTTDAAEMDHLMSRLEELLDELSRGDQRIRSLEELLRAAQEANQAEQEERQQIEKWLNDIEERLAERESEWRAECEVLAGRMEKVCQQRDELYQQLDKATAAVPSPEVPRGVLKKLQKHVDELQEQLRETEAKRDQVLERAQAAEQQLVEGAFEERVEAAVREERLKLAQERAAMSRDRAELARHTNVQWGAEHKDRACEADARFKAFRDTLRELHEEESAPAQRKTGLGSRLADLWRRLDGPTDTD
jgi:hypothetical protein